MAIRKCNLDPFILEITDLIVIICAHVGNILKINKRSSGWLFTLLAIAYFSFRSYNLELVSQSLGHLVSFIIASIAFIKWKKNESE